MISSGDNYPTLKISGTNLQYLLVMLHLGIESKTKTIKTKLNWTNEEFEKQIKPTVKIIENYSNQNDAISKRIETFNHLSKESYTERNREYDQ